MAWDSAIGSPLQTSTKYVIGRAADAISTTTDWNGRARDWWTNYNRAAGADPALAAQGFDGAQQTVGAAAQLVPVGRGAGLAVAAARAGAARAAIPRIFNAALGSDNVGDLVRDRANDAALPLSQRAVDRLSPAARAAMTRWAVSPKHSCPQ